MGVPEVLVIVMVAAILVLPIWAIVDAAKQPPDAFERASAASRRLWMVLPIVFGVVAALIWFAIVRPRVVAAARERPITGPGNPRSI